MWWADAVALRQRTVCGAADSDDERLATVVSVKTRTGAAESDLMQETS